jgi:hypothetical protein
MPRRRVSLDSKEYMNKLTTTLFYTGLTLSLGLTGCSGDDDDTGSSAGTSGASAGTSGTSGKGGSSGMGGGNMGGSSGESAFSVEQFCADLCDCVGDNGGDQAACASGCPDDVEGGATREVCADRLNAAEDGVDACVPVCDALPSR